MSRLKSLSTGSIEVEQEETAYLSNFPKLVDFEAKFRSPKDNVPIKNRIQTFLKKSVGNCNVKRSVLGYFPIIHTVVTYNVKEYLPSDVIAGITAGVMMIPQGMAFAALSTLPPIVGLYISLFASLTYIFLGTGRQLSWGCIAILSLMMANILDKYDNSSESKSFVESLNQTYNKHANDNISATDVMSGDLFINDSSNIVRNETRVDDFYNKITARRIEVASGVTVMAGLILIVASRVGLSRITSIMSNSLITGFTVGISFHVATSQIKGLLGLSIPRYKGIGQLVRTWIAILEHLPETNIAVLIISVICMLIIYLVKRFINEKYKKKMRIPIPIELFVVIIATVIATYTRLDREYNIAIVEDVPTGVPTPKFPDVTLVANYIGDALVIIVVSYAQSLAMAKTFGLKHNYVVDPHQEMLAAGACSIVCGLFSGYITGASVSRSVVQDGAGGRTQIASLFAACMVLLVIMVVGPYFYYLPRCVLSAIIVVNLRSMFLKLLLIPNEWRKSKHDCAVWVFSCIATIILNADIGLLASVLFSLFLVIFRSMIKPVEVIGQIESSSTSGVQLRSVSNYTSVKTFDSVKLVRVRTPLYFFNADTFTTAVFEKTKVNPVLVKEARKERQAILAGMDKGKHDRNGDASSSNAENGEVSHLLDIKVLLIEMSEVSFIDVMGIQALELIINEYGSIGVETLIVGIPESIFGILQSTGFWKKNGDRLFIKVEEALASVAATVENQDINTLKL